MGRLDGKVALITGGGTGIGAEFAKAYVAEGAKVVITGRRKEPLEQVAAGLPEGKVLVFQGDVSTPDGAQAMIDATVGFGGKIDILINNAGIDPAGLITDMPLETWQSVIDINLTGPFLLMKAAIPHMIKQGGGSIINISSLASVRCIPAMPAYIAAKAGLNGLTQSTALDYGKYNIRCNVLAPGPVATEMLKNSMSGLGKAIGTDAHGALKILTKFIPAQRPAEPSEMAGAAVFLGSDESKFMTGAILMLDGGACIVDPCGAAVSSAGSSWG
jgi:NAD(P)-dependent dehydrogenase (short-subunit alcohol dehydrogenase family)